MEDPLNLEQPMKFSGFGLIQNRDLFKVWHFGIPNIDGGQWKLHIKGLVENATQLSLTELRELPANISNGVP